MGISKVEDEHQSTALALSSCSISCSNLVEITQKGTQQGYEEAVTERGKIKKNVKFEEAVQERGKIKKNVRFEEGSNQMIFFTSAKTTHASKKVVCICAPATHVGSFKCRLHRENPSHRFHGHRPSSSLPWIVKHGSRFPKISSPGKVSQQTHHSRYGKISTTNVQQVSAGVHQMQLTN